MNTSLERSTAKPGYFNEKPLLRPILRLKTIIGLQDSCIQTSHAAVLYFEEQALSSGDADEFVKAVCKKHQISLGTSDLEYLKSVQNRSYILQTYNLLEPCFKELNFAYKYYNDFKNEWKKKSGDKNLDPFNQLLENLPSAKRKTIKSYPEYYLMDYYRLIRNSIVHLQDDEDEHKRTLKYFEANLADTLSHFKDNYNLQAPNKPDQISFDDFKLYTRAVKYFSNILNDICFPDLKTLGKVAKNDSKVQKQLENLKKSNASLIKRTKPLNTFFKNHFNHSHVEMRKAFCDDYLKEHL